MIISQLFLQLRKFSALPVVILSVALTGCSEQHNVSVGRINLSEKGSTCEKRFVWSDHYTPEMLLMLSNTNDSTRSIVIQLKVIDPDNGQTVISNQVTREKMHLMTWDSSSTCLSFPIVGQSENLQADHSYKFVLTVTKEIEGLGSARAYMWWVVGDSM